MLALCGLFVFDVRWEITMVLVWRWRLRHTGREGDRKLGWNGI
jgi:hypothetical protein